MSEKAELEPAFPWARFSVANGEIAVDMRHGMSLRDYFAGQFLTTVQIHSAGISAMDVAQQCYVMADAMLAERAK